MGAAYEGHYEANQRQAEGVAMGKLLSKEDRENLALLHRLLADNYNPIIERQLLHPEDVLLNLLAAEQFWRMVVKRCHPVEFFNVHDDDRCYFCGREYRDHGEQYWKNPEQHKPDCPWVLAHQEEA